MAYGYAEQGNRLDDYVTYLHLFDQSMFIDKFDLFFPTEQSTKQKDMCRLMSWYFLLNHCWHQEHPLQTVLTGCLLQVHY